jgi:uncharacterized protein
MITYLRLAEKIIREFGQPLSASEIWAISIEKEYVKELNISGKTPLASLASRLYVDVLHNTETIFQVIGSRPKRFYLKDLSETPDIIPFVKLIKIPKPNFTEKDLHPFLAFYGFNHLNVNIKTIHHNISSKGSFGEWVHPDLVGVYFPFADWENEVVEISSLVGDSSIKLYSFEMKRELTFTNLREAFFQAVSNSSWANEGYLVSAYIDEEKEFRSELERLSSSFGIGVIEIDVEDPDSTKIIFPAEIKENVDWDTANKLFVMNPDFSGFIKRIKKDFTGQEIRSDAYDKVFEKEDLVKTIKTKNNV